MLRFCDQSCLEPTPPPLVKRDQDLGVWGILDFGGPKLAKFSACGGSFPLVKPTSRGPQIAKFSACGGPFPLIKTTSRVPKIAKFYACGGLLL